LKFLKDIRNAIEWTKLKICPLCNKQFEDIPKFKEHLDTHLKEIKSKNELK